MILKPLKLQNQQVILVVLVVVLVVLPKLHLLMAVF
jgi:hypothetical protein